MNSFAWQKHDDQYIHFFDNLNSFWIAAHYL